MLPGVFNTFFLCASGRVFFYLCGQGEEVSERLAAAQKERARQEVAIIALKAQVLTRCPSSVFLFFCSLYPILLLSCVCVASRFVRA